VLVIRHSNGFVVDVVGRSAPKTMMKANRIVDVVREVGRSAAAVVAWGDQDAGDDYQALCERGARTFLLDSYCARHGARPASRNLSASAAAWTRQPAGWWQGVNDAQATVLALNAFAKNASGRV